MHIKYETHFFFIKHGPFSRLVRYLSRRILPFFIEGPRGKLRALCLHFDRKVHAFSFDLNLTYNFNDLFALPSKHQKVCRFFCCLLFYACLFLVEPFFLNHAQNAVVVPEIK